MEIASIELIINQQCNYNSKTGQPPAEDPGTGLSFYYYFKPGALHQVTQNTIVLITNVNLVKFDPQ